MTARIQPEVISIRAPLAALALVSTLLLTACPERTAIWIISGDLPGRPVFGIGRTRDGASLQDLSHVLVSRCEENDGTLARALWVLSRAKLEAPVPRQVTFGEAPVGYHIARGPVRLEPGCYVAQIQGTGRVRFEVRPDRTSVEHSG